ncbi:MAG TPA: glycosyltransferase family 4 protein [Ktedonobacterales bacterium]|jgi:glycosyltransferase involved in cell wall biosynthesis
MNQTISSVQRPAAPSVQVPIRLLYITDAIFTGGDTRCEVWLLDALDKRRFAVTAFTSPQGPTAEQIGKIAGIRHVPTHFGVLEGARARGPMNKLRSLLLFSAALAKVAWVAWRTRPQAIFTGDRTRAMLAALCAARISRRAALVFHPQFFFAPGFANGGLKRRTALRADLVITNSGFTNQSYAQIGVVPEKLLMAYNAIDASRFSPGASPEARARLGIPEDALLIGIFSILRPFKGHAVLLKAMPRVLEAVPNAHLLIVGSGELRPELEQLTQDLGLQRHVTYTGFQRDTLPLYRALDLYAMPSVEEPFGLVTIEAMACEKAVVGADSGGTPEIVDDQETGLLVPTNQIEPLADAIITLLRDPERRQIMGQKGRQRVLEKFTLQGRSEQIAGALEHLVKTRNI